MPRSIRSARYERRTRAFFPQNPCTPCAKALMHASGIHSLRYDRVSCGLRIQPGKTPSSTSNDRWCMATFTVRQGKRYRATISLGWLERWASNDTIAERLRAAGFTDVIVSGSGATRVAEGGWSAADASAEMPAQITQVTEI